MIILRLRGGLGNQLFQFAAAKALALHHKTVLKLDLYYYKKHPYRKFELDRFNIPIELASQDEIHAFTGSNPVARYINKRENYLRCPKVFAQPHYHFYNDWFQLPSDLYLSGYFQSEKFFTPLISELSNWYSPAQPLDQKNESLKSIMQSTQSVSVHVRRGDYTATQFNTFFGTVPEDYYQRAIEKIRDNVKEPHFFVFSDDVQWCRTNLALGENTVFVDYNRGADSYKDLLMMSYCKHNVIANSSFSWWGAWLNSNTDKTVVAPRRWFNQDYNAGKEPVYPCRFYNTNDLIPESWSKL
jgi:hypothetical protein